MKILRRIGRMVLPVIMILSMSVPVFAAEPLGNITIKSPQAGATYSVYKIFDASVDGEGYVYTVNVASSAGMVAKSYVDQEGDEGLALRLSTPGSNTYIVDFDSSKFSSADFAEYLKENVANLGNPVDEKEASTDEKVDTFEDLPMGYYFVSTTTGTLCNLTTVNADVTIYDKNATPDIDKKIDEGTEAGVIDAGDTTLNTASVGDEIPYVLETEVPSMTGYTEYYFIVNDTMSKGLSYNEDMVITVGSKTLTEGTDYTLEVTSTADNGTALEVVFHNFVQYNASDVGARIGITYSATVNEEAEIGNTANTNSVNLTYSNNPKDYSGGVDTTPDKTVYTYVSGIKLTKTNVFGQKLTGATFSIEGDEQNTVIINKEDLNTDAVAEGEVDAEGVLTFEGLAEGTYTITEVKAPEGYNRLTTPIYIKLEYKEEVKDANGIVTQPAGWTAVQVDKDGNALSEEENGVSVNAEGVATISVINKSGYLLPSTGGIGTTIFYVVGAVLVLGAGVLLVVKKRMKREE